MNLNRETWENVTIHDVCEKAQKIDAKNKKGTFNYIDIGSIDSELKRILEIQTIDWCDASSRARQLIRKGDTLFSTVRVNLERIAFIEKEIPNGIASTGFTVLRANRRIIPEFLFYSVIVSNFIQRIVALQKGTAYPAVTDKIVFNQQIPLPPLEEQKRIAALFQSLDAAIEQTEAQEKNLRNLIAKLSAKLINKNPEFGNLIDSDHLPHYTLGSISTEKRESSKEPLAEGFERFVGLEHIEPGNLKINNWGNVADGTTFTKTFKPGDVLFGRRRAYLKKVAVADFRGLCSGDIIVIVPDDNKVLPALFPYYMTAEAVFDHAVSTSAGSLSPRTKWKDLSKFEISLPPMDVQEKILDVFLSIQHTIDLIHKQHLDLKNLKQNLLDEILA